MKPPTPCPPRTKWSSYSTDKSRSRKGILMNSFRSAQRVAWLCSKMNTDGSSPRRKLKSAMRNTLNLSGADEATRTGSGVLLHRSLAGLCQRDQGGLSGGPYSVRLLSYLAECLAQGLG